MNELTDQDLLTERRRAEALRDLCDLHGMADGAATWRATVNAISAEQLARERRNG